MPEKKKQSAVPRLRFPEFRDAGPWEVKRLGEVCDVLQGYGFPERLQGKQQGKYPFCKVSDITNAVSNAGGHIKKAVNYVDDEDVKELRAKPIPKGTTIFAKIGEALRLNKRAFVEVECLIDNNVVGIKGRNSQAIDYFVFYLSQKIDLNKHCGGAVPSVNKSTLQSIKVVVPHLPEQQKIADCLASLDDLIRAEEGQLAALKDHKKGLMQQLFPREGETTPRLRFPEFRDAGPWEAQRLGDVVAAEKSDLSMSEVRPLGSSPFPVYGADGIVGSRDSFQQENTCISMVKDGSGVGRLMLVSGPASVLGTLIWLKPKDRDRVSTTFLFYAISSLDLMRYVVGSGIPHLYFSDISAAKFSFPRLPEQQKIADCLASLDDLIRAKSERIEALKQHKKGLMQQLFPQEVG